MKKNRQRGSKRTQRATGLPRKSKHSSAKRCMWRLTNVRSESERLELQIFVREWGKSSPCRNMLRRLASKLRELMTNVEYRESESPSD